MITGDPIFVELIKRLKEEKPENYHYREINLYNEGQDANEQEILGVGNILEILDFPEYCEIYIRFNESTNQPIRLTKGVFLFTFFRFFLTYKHTNILDAYNNPYLLKILIGKDLISIQYPTSVEKSFLTLVEGQTFDIDLLFPPGQLFYVLPGEFASQKPFPNSFDIRKYNQIRGIVGNQATTGINYFYIRQYFLYENIYQIADEVKIELPNSYTPIPFFVDLVAPYLQFCVERSSIHSLVVYLYAKAWCL